MIAAASIIAFIVLCAPSPRSVHAAEAGAAAPAATTGALARIKQAGKVNIGFVAGARPYVFLDNSGGAD
ncbi:hypothetical protein SB757_28755, partial [Pseudomonas sp. SIMBA_065]